MRHKVRFKNNNNNENVAMTSVFSKNPSVPQRAMSLNPGGRNAPQGRRRSTIFDDMKEFGKKGTDYLNFNVLRGATQ